ncbi:unnamed protein product [Amoebophrya sp. A25]|nr:unnamed protein product [Amoebophrya sp. A25]|eukprot:GSA25T00014379001.1
MGKVDLRALTANVTMAMYGAYAVQMLVGADMMFGANSPIGMVFWPSGVTPVGEWFARACGLTILTVILGPLYCGVSRDSFLKQALFFNVCGVFLGSYGSMMPEAGGAVMWKVQTAINVIVTLLNLYVVLQSKGFIGRAKTPSKSPARGKSPMKKGK